MNRDAAATKRVHRWHSLVTFALTSKKQEAATATGVPVKREYCEYLRSNREFMNSARTRTASLPEPWELTRRVVDRFENGSCLLGISVKASRDEPRRIAAS